MTVDDDSLDLAEAAIVPTTKDLYTSGTKSLDFILQAYSLPPGSTLVFTLTCTQYASAAVYGTGEDDDSIDYTTYDDQIGEASMTIVINSPPTPGYFEISPEYGTELEDMFTFSSSLWSDDDLPITYQYGFQSPIANRIMPVQSRSESTESIATLPSGDSRSDYALECILTVFDDMDANTTVTQTVYVNETADPEGTSTGLINALDASSSLDLVYSVVSATMSVVNSANCTLAPNCTLLHREKCSSVDNTCGECLSGYAGVLGSSNIACYNSSSGDSSRRRLSGHRVGHRFLQSSCAEDDDCEGFAVCTTNSNYGLSKSCVIPSKSCPNDCSGHGTCKFVQVSSSASASRIERSSCQANEFSCEAICECDTYYNGVSCSMTDESMVVRRGIREAAIARLASIFNSSGVSETVDGLTTALVALAEASFSSDEMTWNASQVLLFASQRLAEAAIEDAFELTYDQINLVMDTVEKIAATQDRAKNEYLMALNSTPTTHLHQFVTLAAPSLVDDSSFYSGISLEGSYTLTYNGSESNSIAADASDADMYSALIDMAPIAALMASSEGNITLEVTRKRSATTVEDNGPVYSAVHAVPGNYYLTCPNVHTTCGFEKLPPGEFIMLRDEVTGPYGDFHGRWYRVHSSYRPLFDYDFLPLAEATDFTVPTPFKGSKSTNTTILRWARAYTYHLHFSGSLVEFNPWVIDEFSIASINGLSPSPSSFELNSEEATSVVVTTKDVPMSMPNSTGLVMSTELSQLIAACGKMVAGTMVNGQTPFESVKAGMRITTTMVSSNEQARADSTSELVLGQSAAESALDAVGFTAAVPMKALEEGEDAENVAISVMSIDASLYEVPSDVASDVIFIEMSKLPHYFDAAYSVSGSKRINITIPTSHKVSYAHPALPTIYTHCGDDDWATRTYSCKDIVMSDPSCAAWENIDDYYDEAQFVTATCNGTIGTISSRCDMTYSAPACKSLMSDTGNDESNSITSSGCYMVSYSPETTTCSCPITASGTSSTRRRLAVDNSSTGAIEVNYVALAETVGETFVETWTSTSALDSDAVEDGWQVLATMTTMLLFTIVSLFAVHRMDEKDRAKELGIDENVWGATKKSAIRPDHMDGEEDENALVVVPSKRAKVMVNNSDAQSEEEKKYRKKEEMLYQLYHNKGDQDHWRKVGVHVRSTSVLTNEHEEDIALMERALPAVLQSKPFLLALLKR